MGQPPSQQSAITLSTPIKALHGVGPKRAMRFARLEIKTVADLIRHLPARYEQEHAEGLIGDLPMEGVGSARGTITATRWIPGGRGKGRFQCTIEDHHDRLSLTFFNAPYLKRELLPGMTIRVQGKVKAYQGYPQMTNAKWEAIDEEADTPTKNERLRPVYPSTEKLNSEAIEQIIADVLPIALPQLRDPLPAKYITSINMPPLADAFRMAHQPDHEEETGAARRRLAFNELFLLQLGIAIRRQFNDTQLRATALQFSDAIDQHILQRFPFELTHGQESVIKEIAADLQSTQPMNRLVQGDVGSGKTVVALYALLMAVSDRKQGALMAPTELLATQHFRSISAMLKNSNVRIALLTGTLKAAPRRELIAQIAAGEIDIVVGTHALLTASVRFKDLAVSVVDEQHRFGVEQRAALRTNREGEEATKTESSQDADAPQASTDTRTAVPHCLVMTATPIPRTLSLTVFGDLDISTIKGLPPGRTPIITKVVDQTTSDDVYTYIAKRLRSGEQAYVVVPLIEESLETSDLKSVEAHIELLRQKYCQGLTIEAVHGRLDRDKRDDIMQRFRNGKVDMLVATTVIEVGVDVPNATIMVVEHAERFGLSQLHQLRGRVGRGSDGKKSLCVFIGDPKTEDGQQRLDAIAKTTDGFKIAEADLAIRGMGDFFGTRQHGLPPLRVADIPNDIELLQMAKRDAADVVKKDPRLQSPENELLHKVLWREFGETLGLVDVG
jgi:ATP-dependent DNA helicase RecG